MKMFLKGKIDRKVIKKYVFKPEELENYKKSMLTVEVSGPREQEAATSPVESVASEREDNSLDISQDPNRIFNADEIGAQLCTETAIGKEKESITVLANFTTSGKTVSLRIIMPYERIPQDITVSFPDDYFIGRSDSGCIVGSTFHEYVADHS
ncbi:hypothetical protein JTB14_032955 [Gonioctena quinquepunctata]|nr:hypothetical protein JTB14_032955 [Gonioctena quinquepunctata]